MSPIFITVIHVPSMINAIAESLQNGGHGWRHLAKLLAEDRPADVQRPCESLNKTKQLVRPLIMLPAVRPDDADRLLRRAMCVLLLPLVAVVLSIDRCAPGVVAAITALDCRPITGLF